MKSRETLHNDFLCEVGIFLFRAVEGIGQEPFLVEFQEVFMVSYVSDLRHHEIIGAGG